MIIQASWSLFRPRAGGPERDGDLLRSHSNPMATPGGESGAPAWEALRQAVSGLGVALRQSVCSRGLGKFFTEKKEQEQLLQSNISHRLRTVLSILGLIQQSLPKPYLPSLCGKTGRSERP